MNFSNPNDYYWLQLKINGEILNATVNYTEIKYSDIVTSLEEEVTIVPDEFVLYQNYPNPFNPSTVIEFSLPEDVNNLQLTIYDVLGQRVTQLVNTSLIAGRYSYQWDAGNVATGMYIYELRTNSATGGFVSVKKMILLK